MPYKDKEKSKEYIREYQRKRRRGLTLEKRCKALEPIMIETVQDVKAVLAEFINEVRVSGADIILRARCIGYLAGVILKAIEVGDLETRLQKIEERIEVIVNDKQK
jgi:hypothetical protein